MLDFTSSMQETSVPTRPVQSRSSTRLVSAYNRSNNRSTHVSIGETKVQKRNANALANRSSQGSKPKRKLPKPSFAELAPPLQKIQDWRKGQKMSRNQRRLNRSAAVMATAEESNLKGTDSTSSSSAEAVLTTAEESNLKGTDSTSSPHKRSQSDSFGCFSGNSVRVLSEGERFHTLVRREQERQGQMDMGIASQETQHKNPKPSDAELVDAELVPLQQNQEGQELMDIDIDPNLINVVNSFSQQLIGWDLSEQEIIALCRRLVECLRDKCKSTDINAIFPFLLNGCANPVDNGIFPKYTVMGHADTSHDDEIVRIHKAVDRIVVVGRIDDSKVTTVNHIVLSEADRICSVRQLEACVLSLYLHAIRVHTMTRNFFLDKPSYSQLRDEDYKGHKDFLLLFETGDNSFDLDSVRNACAVTPYSGDRKLTAVINHFFPSRGLYLIPDVFFQNREASKIMTNVIVASLDQIGNVVDMSVLFIDFLPFESKLKDFPNRLAITHQNIVYAYQTIGAVYKSIDGLNNYAHRIVSRGRNSGDYFRHDYFYDQNYFELKESAPVCYRDKGQFNFEVGFCEYVLSKEKPISMFPSEIKGNNTTKYRLEGVVMCLNEAQRDRDGIIRAPDNTNDYQLTLSRLDPVLCRSGIKVHAQEMEILETNKWLTDEIINAAMLVFMQRCKDLRSTAGSSPSAHDDGAEVANDSKIPVVIHQFAFIQMLESLEEAPPPQDTVRNAKKKKCIAKKVVNAQEFEDGYQRSKLLWDYRNLFSCSTWFFSIINYPDNTHWIFLALHSGEKFLLIHDPLHNDHNAESLSTILQHYIDKEASEHCELDKTVDLGDLQWAAWRISSFKAQQQPDSCSCGVLSLIAFFRSLNLVFSGASSDDIAASWSIPITPASKLQYRHMLKQMLLENDGEIEAFNFFQELLRN
jgi:hypothetical protein